jgi:hypothetical protein
LVRPFARHRIVSLIPILLLAIATVIGGWANTTDMRAHLVDDFTSEPAKNGSVTFGSRSAPVDQTTGAFTLPNVPRTSQVKAEAPGYLVKTVPTTEEEIRLAPLSFTVEVIDSADKSKHIVGAQVRQGDKLLVTTTESVTAIITPHPGKDAKLLVCAAGYDQKEILAHGVLLTVELSAGTNACPPLPTPTPSPSPSATPSASPGSPSPAPSPSPTSSP